MLARVDVMLPMAICQH